jgi:hypothetical protein
MLSLEVPMGWSIRMFDSNTEEVLNTVDFPSDIPRDLLRDTMVSMMRTVAEGEPRIMLIRDFGECWNDTSDIIITASLDNG